MERDIVLRLFSLLWYMQNEIRAVIGMCEKHYRWKMHKYFLKSRPVKQPTFFRPNSKAGCQITHTFSGEQCTFSNESTVRTIFLSTKITKGVFRWNVRISYGSKKSNNDSYFYMGVASYDLLEKCADGLLNGVGTCSFLFERDHDGSLNLSLRGVVEPPDAAGNSGGTTVPDNSVVSVEADVAARTLSFFAGEKKASDVISYIPVPFHFGMSGYADQSFVSLSLLRLAVSTPSASACCRYFECKRKNKSKR